MRHRKKVKKLGRNASHRKAMLRNMASALIEHHQIKTTLAKAKAARGYIEKLISYGKTDTVHSRRLAFKFLQNRDLVKTLFDDIAATYSDRNGGYTRVVKLGKRRGDGAEMAILQLVGFESLIIDEEASKSKKRKAAKTESEDTTVTAAPVTETEVVEEVEDIAAETTTEETEVAATTEEGVEAETEPEAAQAEEEAEAPKEEKEKTEEKEKEDVEPEKEAEAKAETKPKKKPEKKTDDESEKKESE